MSIGYVILPWEKSFKFFIFLKYFLLIVGKKSRLEFPMRQRLHFKLSLISSTVTISILTLLFYLCNFEGGCEEVSGFFLLQNSFGAATLDLDLMFFRRRNSAERAPLTFLILVEECGLTECIRICGNFLKL